MPEICVRVSYKGRLHMEVALTDYELDSVRDDQRRFLGTTVLTALNAIRKEYHTRLPKPCADPRPRASAWERLLWSAGWFEIGKRLPRRYGFRCGCGWPVSQHGEART